MNSNGQLEILLIKLIISFKKSHNCLFAEPFLESLPQVHLIMAIVLRGPASLQNSSQSNGTFLLSVFSACFGMSKFFNVGPSRLIPYDKMNLGFFVLMVNIASCFIGKGLLLVHANGDLQGVYKRFLTWITLALLPQIIFVSTYIVIHTYVHTM